MSSNISLSRDSPPETWSGVAAGLAIFLIASVMLILSELPHAVGTPALTGTLYMLGFWGLLLSPELGFIAGWIRGFPRWSYPYPVPALLMALFIAFVSTPGLTILGYPTFGRELWGLRAFIPLLLGTGIAWLITRSFQPMKHFFTQMGRDWTLATFALTGTLPLFILISYDEMDRGYSLRDMVILSFLMILMALFYLRSRSYRQRWLALGLGILLIIGFTKLSTTAYWLSLDPGHVNVRGAILWTLIVTAIYLSPILLSVLVRTVFRPTVEA
jgi:hypothetical protein